MELSTLSHFIKGKAGATDESKGKTDRFADLKIQMYRNLEELREKMENAKEVEVCI